MILGCDPGATGALARLTDGGDLLAVADVPIVEVRGRKRVSAPGLAALLREWAPRLAVIEQVGTRPGEGAVGAFAFGYSAGLIEGACAMAGIPVVFVQPAVWKRGMKVTADKGSSRLMAQRLWPAHAALFARVKDDGRAESALIGFYGRMLWQRERSSALETPFGVSPPSGDGSPSEIGKGAEGRPMGAS